jgi:hypothetical protein
MPTKKLFVETSVPRKLLLGHPLSKKQITSHIGQAKCWSSQYVRMEFKRSVVQNLIHVYNVAQEEDTPADTLNVIAETFSDRLPKLLLGAISNLVNQSDISNNKQKFLYKLETLIHFAEQFLDDLVEDYVNSETGCPLAKASTKTSYEKFLEEIDCKTECRVEQLWSKNHGNLKRLSGPLSTQAPHSRNKGFTKPLNLVRQAIADPSRPKSKRNCMAAGDFVIALEMPKQYRMLTFDLAFESICQILGKEVFRFPALSTLTAQRPSASTPPEP